MTMMLPDLILRDLTALPIRYSTANRGRKVLPPEHLSVTVPHQDTPFWCWAAVASGIAYSYGNVTFPQHVVASGVLGVTCQPNGVKPPDCNCAGSLADALCVTDNLWDSPVMRSYSFPEVYRAIKAKRPLCVRGEDSNKAGHFVVIFGYSTNGLHLLIADPSEGIQFPTFDRFVKAYRGIYAWNTTYETKSHKDVPHCVYTPPGVPQC